MQDGTFKMHAPVALQQVGHVDVLWPGAGSQDVADGGAAPQVQHAPTQRKYINIEDSKKIYVSLL